MQKSFDPGTIKTTITVFLVTSVVFYIDRISKQFFLTQANDQIIIHNLLAIIKHKNTGLIANLAVPMEFIIFVSLGAMLFISIALYQTIKDNDLMITLSLSLIIGGAVGNFFDRITHGYVFDWLLFFNRSVMNFADIAIGSGIILYLLVVLYRKQNIDTIK